MKKILKLFLVLSVVIAAIGCSQDQIATQFDTSGEDAKTAYFVQKVLLEELDREIVGSKTVFVDVYRQSAVGTIDVSIDYIVPEKSEGIYQFPESITFNDGDYMVSIPLVVLNVDKFVIGQSYPVDICLAELVEPEMPGIGSKYSKITVTTQLSLDWQPVYMLKDLSKIFDANLTDADYMLNTDGNRILQKVAYTYNLIWKGEDTSVGLQRVNGTNIFRMTNWGGGVNLIFTAQPETEIEVEGTKYPRCVIGVQEIGSVDPTHGIMYVSDYPSYDSSATYAEYPAYWDADSNTFNFTLIYFVGAGNFGGAMETLVLLGYQSDLK